MATPRLNRKPPKDAAAKIMKYAAAGMGVKEISRAFRIDDKTFKKWRDFFPELEEAYRSGRELEEKELVELLKKHAQTNPASAMFLLKTRHGYREGDQQATANNVSVTFELPGPQSVEDYSRVIEGQCRGKD